MNNHVTPRHGIGTQLLCPWNNGIIVNTFPSSPAVSDISSGGLGRVCVADSGVVPWKVREAPHEILVHIMLVVLSI